MMLTVQTMSNSVEGEVRNGSSQRRYQGNTAGAKKRDAAIGQANTSRRNSGNALLSQLAVTNPASTANAVSNCGGATSSSAANTGPLKRNVCTYVPSDPVEMPPRSRNGMYRSPTTTAASAASRMRTRFQ